MLIAGPNLTVDRLIGLDQFDVGNIHRAHDVTTQIGGGGPNAARTAVQLGGKARLITLIPEPDVPTVAAALANDGVKTEWISCPGNLRVATILREERGRMSVLNEPGPSVSPREWNAYAKLVESRLLAGEVLLCSGSLPPGAPASGYARLAAQARHNGSRCIIDVAGPALEAALDAGEGMIVPNLAEAETLIDGPRAQAVHAEGDQPERARDAAEALLRRGAVRAVVTAGSAGAAYAEQGPRGLRGWVDAPRVEAASPIGAGDAFAASLGLRVEAGAPLDEAVRFATAAAAAHVESPNRHLTPERASELSDSLHAAA